MGKIAAEQVLDALDGKPVKRIVNPQVWPDYAKRFEKPSASRRGSNAVIRGAAPQRPQSFLLAISAPLAIASILAQTMLAMHFVRSGEAREAAIGAGDHVLPAHEIGEADDALGDQFGMLDQHRGVGDDARDQHRVFRELRFLPHFPFVLVPRIGSLEGKRAGADLHQNVDDVLGLEVMHPRAEIDAIAGVIADLSRSVCRAARD